MINLLSSVLDGFDTSNNLMSRTLNGFNVYQPQSVTDLDLDYPLYAEFYQITYSAVFEQITYSAELDQ